MRVPIIHDLLPTNERFYGRFYNSSACIPVIIIDRVIRRRTNLKGASVSRSFSLSLSLSLSLPFSPSLSLPRRKRNRAERGRERKGERKGERKLKKRRKKEKKKAKQKSKCSAFLISHVLSARIGRTLLLSRGRKVNILNV